MNNIYSSLLLNDAVNEFSRLPGVGKKTALRFVLHLLRQNKNDTENFGNTIIKLSNEIIYCQLCHNISDDDTCKICSNPSRDKSVICVVEDIRDVIAIENTNQYKGLYHILGGIISPIDGIGPSDINIDSLFKRIAEEGVKEVIFALRATMEGDTTNFYIFKKIKDLNISISTIAKGIAIGDELEYTDEITLGRSIVNRTPFEKTFI